MDNVAFVDEENIPMIHQDEEDDDYDNYNAPDTSRVDETSFIEHDATEATSTLHLRQKLKRDKIVSLYRYLGVTGDPGLTDLDQFMTKKIQKQVILNCFFSMLINIGNPLATSVLVKSEKCFEPR